MIFANIYKSPPPRIHNRIGIAPVTSRPLFGCGFLSPLRRQRLWLRSRRLLVDALIGKVRKEDSPLLNYIIAAAVFVNTRARVEPGRCYVGLAPVGVAPDNDIAAALGRPHLDPVPIKPFKLQLTEANSF